MCWHQFIMPSTQGSPWEAGGCSDLGRIRHRISQLMCLSSTGLRLSYKGSDTVRGTGKDGKEREWESVFLLAGEPLSWKWGQGEGSERNNIELGGWGLSSWHWCCRTTGKNFRGVIIFHISRWKRRILWKKEQWVRKGETEWCQQWKKPGMRYKTVMLGELQGLML